MEIPTSYIIDAMNSNILDIRIPRVDSLTRQRVHDFKILLNKNETNLELFHSHLNVMNKELENFLSLNFKRLISYYNQQYEKFRLKKLEQQKLLIEMADDFNANLLNSALDGLSFSGDISSLANSFKKTAISKKRPSRKRRI